MEKVIITRPFVGICGMQVCAEKHATDAEILDVCNRQNVCGTTNGWTKVVRENEGEDSLFAGPGAQPVQCVDDPDRMHFIVLC